MSKLKPALPALIVALAILARLIPGPRTIDDAFITFRYARSILAGQGFVYNPGEAVLGTTTPLYTLLMAGLGALTGGVQAPFPQLAMLVNALADAATCLMLWRLGRRLGFERAGLAAALAWAVAPFSVTFAIGGLETSLYIAFLTGAVTAAIFAHTSIESGACFCWHDRASKNRLKVPPPRRPAGLPRPAHPPRRPHPARAPGARTPVVRLEAQRNHPPRRAGCRPAALWRLGHLRRPGIRQPAAPLHPCQGRRLPPRFWRSPHPPHPALRHPLPRRGSARRRACRRAGPLSVSFPYLPGSARHLEETPVYTPGGGSLVALPLALPADLCPAQPAHLPLVPHPAPAGLFLLHFYRPGIPAAAPHGAQIHPSPPHPAAVGNLVLIIPVLVSLADWRLAPDNGPAVPLAASGENIALTAPNPAPDMAFVQLEQLYRQAAARIAPQLTSRSTLAAGDVGVLGYFTPARILDTVGLNSAISTTYYPLPADQYVINYAIPTALILDQQPDWIVILEVYARRTFLPDPRFQSAYRLVEKIPTTLYSSDGLLIFQRIKD